MKYPESGGAEDAGVINCKRRESFGVKKLNFAGFLMLWNL